MFRTLCGYKSRAVNWEVNLPGTGDTVINQAVPPGGDSGIALCWVEACDLPKRGRLGCAIFGRGGLRSRIPHPDIDKNQILPAIYQTSESSWHSGARPIDYSVWWRFFLSFQSILNNPAPAIVSGVNNLTIGAVHSIQPLVSLSCILKTWPYDQQPSYTKSLHITTL